MQQKEIQDKRVYKYQFDDPEINDVLDKLSESMVIEKENYQKSIKQTKTMVALAAGLLITLFEYLLSSSFYYPPITLINILFSIFSLCFQSGTIDVKNE